MRKLCEGEPGAWGGWQGGITSGGERRWKAGGRFGNHQHAEGRVVGKVERHIRPDGAVAISGVDELGMLVVYLAAGGGANANGLGRASSSAAGCV